MIASVIQASGVSKALKTLLELSKPEVVMEGLISDDVLEDILASAAASAQQQGNDNVFVQLLLLVLEKSTLLGQLQMQSMKTLIQLIQISKSLIQQRLLQVLATRGVSEEDFEDIEAEVLALARSINKNDDWHVKLEAMRFYSNALLPTCSKRLLTRRVDFIFPVMEKLSARAATVEDLQHYQLHQLKYLLNLSCTPSFADAVENSIPETYLVELCFKAGFEHVDVSKFLNFVLNLSKTAKGKAVLMENQNKLKSWLKLHLIGRTGVLAFLVFVSVFGPNAANQEFNECLDKFTQTLEFMSSELDANVSSKHPGEDTLAFAHTLELAMESLLEVLDTKPVGKIPDFCPGFLHGNLIGRIAHVAYHQQPSSAQFRRTVLGICYTLGCQTANKDKLYECLKQENVIALLQEDKEVDKDKRAEVLRWRPVDEDDNIKSLGIVTKCDPETCRKILLEVDLGNAIRRYFEINDGHPDKSPNELGKILLKEVKSHKRMKMEST